MKDVLQQPMSRRDFLRFSGLTSLGAALSGCQPIQPIQEMTEICNVGDTGSSLHINLADQEGDKAIAKLYIEDRTNGMTIETTKDFSGTVTYIGGEKYPCIQFDGDKLSDEPLLY